ncbi:stalk domain-containing protein [Cohnella cellulosilytica]|uniref:Stalk domain-containing protein n=2 Tax=Cohnella cellulosilytica TaxID=986710 RepID=A0ABW2F882_9BACL
MKRLITGTIAFFFFAALLPIQANAAGEERGPAKHPLARVAVNGEYVEFPESLSATIIDGRVFVPIRLVQHSQIQADYLFGQERNGLFYLSVKGPLNYITLAFGNGVKMLRISDYDSEDSRQEELGGAVPYIQGEEAMVPLRVLGEAMGLDVEWDNEAKVARLETDEKYEAELESAEEWEEGMGEYPVHWDEQFAEPITEEELLSFIEENRLSIADYRLEYEYAAIVLEVGEHESIIYTVDRLRNGQLGAHDLRFSAGENGEGISVKKAAGYLSVAIHEKARQHQIDSCIVSFSINGEMKRLKFDIGDKPGYLLPIGQDVTSGKIYLYGNDGFFYENWFW